MNNFDLIVIGAGPGGYMAALEAAKLGLRTAVAEDREPGGTCLNRGCIPTKTLLHSSQIYRDALNGEPAGIRAEKIQADIPAIFAYKRRIAEKLSSGVADLLKGAKVELLRGRARISAPGRVEVTARNGEKSVHTAELILVATGSVPARPPIPGLELPGVMTSDELLEGADHLYRSIVIIGGGVIGIEFATFYADLGCQVTVIEGLDRLLPGMDRELGQNLAQILKKRGVDIYTKSMVERVEQSPGGLTVQFTAKGSSAAVTGEAVLCAIGRKPYLDGLFSPDLQPEMNGRSLRVDADFRTSIPGIYAIGDVSSRIQLAHVATAQGIACVRKICGKESATNLKIVPSCIYCRPEIAAVGMTEAEAKEAGISVKVGKCTLSANARTMIADPGRSFMKLVANSETHEILGAQLMCEHSSDIISQIAQAMANRLTAEQLLLAMRPHPSFEEAMTAALSDLTAKLA